MGGEKQKVTTVSENTLNISETKAGIFNKLFEINILMPGPLLSKKLFPFGLSCIWRYGSEHTSLPFLHGKVRLRSKYLWVQNRAGIKGNRNYFV